MRSNTYLYLAGHITGELGTPDVNPTFTWRAEIRDYYKDSNSIRIIDPTFVNWDAQFCKDNPEDNMRAKSYRKATASILLNKSYAAVKRTDVMLLNMNMFGSKSTPQGTLMEAAWGWTFPHITKIGIYNEGAVTKSDICNHPFLKNIVNVWVKNAKQACQVVDSLFVPTEDHTVAPLTAEDLKSFLEEVN